MSEAEERKTPKEVIEQIRSENYLLDIDEESDKVKRGAKSLQQMISSMLKLLSEDLYSKKTHFVLELVQNADDNDYHAGVEPKLTFKLNPKCLVLVNNEIGFNEQNVRALCNVGASSKANKAGYIGEKGIGFKSVFTVSNAPEIHSNGYHFRFDRTNQSNLLGYVVPNWCDTPEEAKSNTTTIVLPATDGSAFSKETLEGLDARPLLFLSKLRSIELQHDNETVIYKRRDEEGLSCLSTIIEQPNSKRQIEESHFVRVSVNFKMEDVPDEKRLNISKSAVVLAFPVDEKGLARPEPSSQVFAFLPIRQVGFKFSIQADFILSSGREDILTDRPWNILLRNAIAVAFKTAVATFKKTGELAFSYLKFIPAEGEISDPFFRPVVKSIIDQLAQTECLPSSGGPWKRPNDLRIADKDFRVLFPSAVAMELFGFDYVDNRVQGGNELLRRLGAKDIVVDDYLSIFKKHSAWFKQQPLDWKARFYARLAEINEQKLTAGLVSVPSIPTNSGDLAVPALTSVFYPLSRGKKYGFEHELVIIDSELYDQALQYSEKVKDLFVSLEVKPDDPYDLVTSHILPRHLGESWKTSEHKALIGHLRYIKDKFKDYLDGAAKAGKTEAQALQILRGGMWLGTKHIKDGIWHFGRSGTLYLSKEYKPLFCLESLLGDAISETRLVSSDYLTAKTKDPEAEAESWRQFFQRLGLCFSPSVVQIGGGDWQCSDELRLLLGSSQSSVRKATLECIDQNWGQYESRLSYSQQVGRNLIKRDTTFILALRATQTPTKKKTSVALADSFYPTQEFLELFGERLPYVDATLTTSMRDACHIAHRLDAKACVKRLVQLKAEGGDTAKQIQAIYRHLERFWNSDSAFIKQSFESDGLIRIKGSQTGWAKPDDVTWNSSGQFLDSLYPPLHGQYRDFSSFFIDKLGVSKNLPTSMWVESLLKLGTIESIDERRNQALAIYAHAARDLAPRFGRIEALAPDWLSTFEDNDVFLNHRDELVPNDEHLFANDVPELAILFSDDANISLLGISSDEVPRIARLLDATNVQRLSASFTVEVLESAGGRLDNKLTAKVRRSVIYLGRVLYAKSHVRFESAVEQGLFFRLGEIQIEEVPELKLSVKLGQITRTTTADIAGDDGRIFIKTGARSINDQLAAELCKFLGSSDELADTFARVLMEDDADRVEDFLQVRHIGPLPPDLEQALEGKGEALYQGEQAEETQDTETSEVTFEQSTDIKPQKADTQTPSEISTPAVVSPGHNNEIGKSQQVSSLNKRSPATTPLVEKQQGTLPSATKPVSVNEGDSAGRHIDNGTLQDTTGDLPQITYRGSSNRPTGLTKRKRHHGQRIRTKSGRLMSYAASPGDIERPNAEDDPAKAAAREAIGKAAVEYFMATQAARWQSLTNMPHNNPGFDVHAVAHDGTEEFIEVKGQGRAWTEDGVALTPKELETALEKGERYWLCVVEHAQDEQRRALYLVNNPYGLTQQFRFDSGWKSTAINNVAVPIKPEAGLFIDIPDVGHGRIQSVKKKGVFFTLHVILDDGRQVFKPFNPANMKLSAE